MSKPWIMAAEIILLAATLGAVAMFAKYCEDVRRAWPSHSKDPHDPYTED